MDRPPLSPRSRLNAGLVDKNKQSKRYPPPPRLSKALRPPYSNENDKHGNVSDIVSFTSPTVELTDAINSHPFEKEITVSVSSVQGLLSEYEQTLRDLSEAKTSLADVVQEVITLENEVCVSLFGTSFC